MCQLIFVSALPGWFSAVAEPGRIRTAGELPFMKVKAVAHLKIRSLAFNRPSLSWCRNTPLNPARLSPIFVRPTAVLSRWKILIPLPANSGDVTGPMRITASWRGMSLSRREICILSGKPIAKRRSAGCYIASPNAIRKCRETWLRFSGLSPRSPGSCVKKACLTCCSPMGATSWRFAQRIYTGLRDGRRLA